MAVVGILVAFRLLSSVGGAPRTGQKASAPATKPPTSKEMPQQFIPSTHEEEGRAVLPVTFPDGSTAELTYPPRLDLAGMGVRPYWVGCGGDFGFFHYDPYRTVYEGKPLQKWTGTDGRTVGLWRGVKGDGPRDHLIFHFGPWTVEKFEYRGSAASSQEDLTACAEGLRGRVTQDGWIVLDGPPAIGLPRKTYGPGGAELQFGGLSPRRRFILLWPGPCKGYDYEGVTEIDGIHVDLSKDFADWCDRGQMMTIHVYFEPGSRFFEDVFRGVQVRNVRLAS